MKRTILGFELDEMGDWAARLDCGHRRHTRHDPPWRERPAMATEAGRSSLIGNPLACVRCDRHDLPEGAEAHEETALFDETTVPPALLQAYATGQGVWSRFEVLSGSVRYVVGPPVDRAFVLNAGDSGIIAPALVHRVELVGPTRFRIVFYREC